jgi:hypothetical protein
MTTAAPHPFLTFTEALAEMPYVVTVVTDLPGAEAIVERDKAARLCRTQPGGELLLVVSLYEPGTFVATCDVCRRVTAHRIVNKLAVCQSHK